VSPEISVILATDRYETIRPVVECLRRQTVKDRVELVVVAPRREPLELDDVESDGLAGVRIVETANVETFAAARAAAVRASSAPVIVIGETHTYPHPGWAEALIKAHAHPCAVVVPGFGNANPQGALSWAIFLLDYGRWLAGLPAGETSLAPTHNSSYKRGMLLELGPALETALAHGDAMAVACRERGHRAYFEPAARIDHLNISRPGPWLYERFLAGLLIAGRRAARWPWWTRLLYLGGSPLIPAVVLSRLWGALRLARRQSRLPAGTLPALLVGAVISAVGEAVGYARGSGRGAAVQMTEYELHKVRYAS
jgi:Glycosyl transferase family 2